MQRCGWRLLDETQDTASHTQDGEACTFKNLVTRGFPQ